MILLVFYSEWLITFKLYFKWDNSEAIYKNRDLPSTDSLDTWAGMMETEDADPKVDLYAVFGYDQWDFQPCTTSSANYRGNGQCVSTKGVGFVGTACKDYSKISFNEYSKTTAETAMVNMNILIEIIILYS